MYTGVVATFRFGARRDHPSALSGSTVTRWVFLAPLEGRSTTASTERNTKQPAGEAVLAGRALPGGMFFATALGV